MKAVKKKPRSSNTVKSLRRELRDVYTEAFSARKALQLATAQKNEPPPWLSEMWDATNRAIGRFDEAAALLRRAREDIRAEHHSARRRYKKGSRS